MLKRKNAEELRTYIEEMDDEDLIALCREINSYSGAFDNANIHDFEELSEVMESYDFGRAIVYGNVTNVTLPVRFNGYGNLENVTEWDIAEECRNDIEEIIYQLKENYSNLYLDDELMELIQKTEEQ